MRSVTLKSAITPSFMGRIATIFPGVRPTISLASLPTAITSPVFLLRATMEGSFTTIPLPLAKTNVLAVPRSMAKSEEKRLNKERTFIRMYLFWAAVDRLEPGLPVQSSAYHTLEEIQGESKRAFVVRTRVEPSTAKAIFQQLGRRGQVRVNLSKRRP